jgi:hypothetical protein
MHKHVLSITQGGALCQAMFKTFKAKACSIDFSYLHACLLQALQSHQPHYNVLLPTTSQDVLAIVLLYYEPAMQ